MAKVIVLAGGTSDEREISLRSGDGVANALREAGYEVIVLDPGDGLDALLPELKKADVVFPALHGVGGEDGTIQKFLEDHGIRYVGPDSKASAICFDKAKFDQLLHQHGIKTPNTLLVKYQAYTESELAKNPYVLKPNDGGSSIDTFIVRDPAQADTEAIKAAFQRHNQLLLQELIPGTEITVAMLGDEPLPVIEIIPPENGEFDYENKYNGQTQELCPPQHVSQELQVNAQVLAKEVHQLTGCRHLSRTDIMITPSDDLYVLETNTIPGLTGESLVPKAGKQAGYSMPELCDKLVRMALQHNT